MYIQSGIDMKLINPLQVNISEIKKLLVVVISLQLSIWGLIWLDSIGMHVPVFRQMLIFIYLTFVPGILLLRVLKVHDISILETLLYSVGLSISVLMFAGLFINVLLPRLGIPDPISLNILVLMYSVIVLALCALSYVRDKDYAIDRYIDLKSLVSKPVLVLCLIPLVSILGTYCMNSYGVNTVLVFLIALICLVILSVYFYGFINPGLYPLAVFVIALALLYHTSLISSYIWGWDINEEYYFSHLVVSGAIWDQTILANVNGMLSVVMLAPVYSIMGNIDLVWVFKAIYPFFFAFVPLGIYCVLKKQVNAKIALLSCLLFISYFVFFTEMVSLARQEIAELFLVLLILLIINKTLDLRTWAVFFTIFSVSLIVSHYAISYIFLFMLLWMYLVVIFIHLMRRSFVSRIIPGFGQLFSRMQDGLDLIADKQKMILLMVYLVVLIVWYSYVSRSSLLTTVIFLFYRISDNLFINFLNPDTAEGYAIILSGATTPLHQAYKYIQLTVQGFIFLGLLAAIIRPKMANFNKNYLALSVLSLFICIFGIVIPYFASILNTTRLYQITLILLAPFFILGVSAVFSLLNKIPGRLSINPIKVASVFMVIFLLFNTGLVFEAADDRPTSFALNHNVDTAVFNSQEITGAKWIVDERNDIGMNTRSQIIADGYRWVVFFGMTFINVKPLQNNILPHHSYLYLGTYNLENDKVYTMIEKKNISATYEYLNSSSIVAGLDEIYDNEQSAVYYII
jgi:uncharacterized membrane protein